MPESESPDVPGTAPDSRAAQPVEGTEASGPQSEAPDEPASQNAAGQDCPADAQAVTASDGAKPAGPAEPARPARSEKPTRPAKSGKPGKPAQKKTEGPSVIVRYGAMRQIGRFRHSLEFPPTVGTKVVVRSERGVELGEVIAVVGSRQPGCGWACLDNGKLNAFLKAGGDEYPFYRNGRVLRLANHQDIVDQRHLASSARDEAAFCREQIRQMKLGMKVVGVEHLLGGERIIFYFSAESRVDFRELVRRLASQYRTRIEMRQVGARDEARLVGDYERCGQRCCCQGFLKALKPVSMRMAKTQKATLDPAKISGRCGRLMCCLRYEDATYEELRKKLPRKNTYVRAGELIGRVVDTQILTQLVSLELPDRKREVVANEEITERNVSPPKAADSAAPPPKPAPPKEKPPRRMLRDEPRAGGTDKPSQAPKVDSAADAAPAEPSSQTQSPTQPSAQQEGAKRGKRRRRRRPRGKRGSRNKSGGKSQ